MFLKILLYIVVVIILIILLLGFSDIKIHITKANFKFDNNKFRINNDFQIIFSLVIFNKIVYFRKNIKKNKIRPGLTKKKKRKSMYFKNIIKRLKIEKLDLLITGGFEDASLTAICIGIISILISIIIRSIGENSKNINWSVTPTYDGKNYYEVKLDCIFTVKIVSLVPCHLYRRFLAPLPLVPEIFGKKKHDFCGNL